VIAAALAGGLVSADDVVWRGVAVEQIGRSHSVYRLSVADAPRAVLKAFHVRRGETDGDLEREQAVVVLAGTCKPLADILPPPMAWHGAANVIVTQAVEGVVAWSIDRHGGGEAEPSLAWSELIALLAPRLAALHRATRNLAAPGAAPHPVLSGPVPWGLRLFDGDAPADVWRTPTLSRLLAEMAADAFLVSGIRAARSNWRNLCFVHGDLKHDNILVGSTATQPSLTVVDWEMARIGDPAWDLAALAARLRLTSFGDETWTEDNLHGCALLVHTYARASGLNTSALVRRLVLYIGTWLVMVAIQHRSTLSQDDAGNSVSRIVASAVSTFRNADKLTNSLLERSV
jgi:aminoglycoside phosphotransferase (APT) family kinase protein